MKSKIPDLYSAINITLTTDFYLLIVRISIEYQFHFSQSTGANFICTLNFYCSIYFINFRFSVRCSLFFVSFLQILRYLLVIQNERKRQQVSSIIWRRGASDEQNQTVGVRDGKFNLYCLRFNVFDLQ